MTKVDIIKETFAFYSEDVKRRSLSTDEGGNICVYNGHNGTHCAVGRCMLEGYKSQGADMRYNTLTGIYSLVNKLKLGGIDQLLEGNYRGHNIDFWADLQALHDTNSNWDEDGATDRGNVEYIRLLEYFAE